MDTDKTPGEEVTNSASPESMLHGRQTIQPIRDSEKTAAEVNVATENQSFTPVVPAGQTATVAPPPSINGADIYPDAVAIAMASSKDFETRNERPVGVVVICVIQAIATLPYVYIALFVPVIAMFVLIQMLLIYSFFKGRNWARIVNIVLTVLSLIGNVYGLFGRAIFTGSTGGAYENIAPIVTIILDIILLIYLQYPSVKRYFRSY